MLALTLGAAAFSSIPASASPVSGHTAHATAYVNLRSGPSMGYSVERVVPSNASVYVNGGPYGPGWYKVTYNGTTGYIWKAYLSGGGGATSQRSYSPAVSGSHAMTTSALNLRSGAGIGYGVMRVIPYHGLVAVYGGPYNGGWYKVNYGGTVGYVWGSYISRNIGGSQSTQAQRTATTQTTSSSGYSSRGVAIANLARSLNGYPYAWGGTSPAGFDCSGLVVYVYSRFGISVPHSVDMLANYGRYVPKSQLQPGDILIFQNTYKPGPSHAAVYLGNGMMMSANNPSQGVLYQNINDSYWGPKFYAGRRP